MHVFLGFVSPIKPTLDPVSFGVDIDTSQASEWYIHWENISCITDDDEGSTTRLQRGVQQQSWLMRGSKVHDSLASCFFA